MCSPPPPDLGGYPATASLNCQPAPILHPLSVNQTLISLLTPARTHALQNRPPTHPPPPFAR